MTSLDIATGRPDPTPDPHEVAFAAQVHNATIALCQGELRALADTMERTLPGAGLPMAMVASYRSAADHLGALRI